MHGRLRFDDLIVVLPGIGGSTLHRGDVPVWDPPLALGGPLRRHGRALEALAGDPRLLDDPDHDDGITPSGLIGLPVTIPGLAKLNQYRRLRRALHGCFDLVPGDCAVDGPPANHFEFAYDWRHPMVDGQWTTTPLPAAPEPVVSAPSRSRTYAVVVGVETYAEGHPRPTLNGPAHDARGIVQWLLGEGVPAGNTTALVSPVDGNRGVMEGSGVPVREATNGNLMTALLRETAERTDADLLLVFWSGHGFTDADGSQYLQAADDTDGRSVSLTNLLTRFRSREVSTCDEQFWFIDACATTPRADGGEAPVTPGEPCRSPGSPPPPARLHGVRAGERRDRTTGTGRPVLPPADGGAPRGRALGRGRVVRAGREAGRALRRTA